MSLGQRDTELLGELAIPQTVLRSVSFEPRRDLRCHTHVFAYHEHFGKRRVRLSLTA